MPKMTIWAAIIQYLSQLPEGEYRTATEISNAIGRKLSSVSHVLWLRAGRELSAKANHGVRDGNGYCLSGSFRQQLGLK